MCSLSISSSKARNSSALKKRFLLLLLFFGLFFICDRGICFFLNTGFRRTTTGEAGGIVNEALQKKFDIVILGSSRAVLHYDPRILSSKLNMPAYNVGCNGQNLHYARGVIDLILKKQTPSIAIIDIDAGSVLDAEIDLNKATVLAPFMDESGIIKNMIYSKGPLERLKYLSHSYRFNSKPFSILKNLFVKNKTIDGFSPRAAVMDPQKISQIIVPDQVDSDPALIDLLREIIIELKGAGTHVVLVLSPRWTKEGELPHYRMPILREIRALTKNEGVSFLAVTIENTPVFQKSDYYKDAAHLNTEGAKVFSEILAEKLDSLAENQFQPVYDEL